MARRKAHKISVQTKGLSDADAARLFYLISSAGRAFDANAESASNVSLSTLRKHFPDADWHRVTAAERIRLVS
jgi:hypothetical protein